MIHHVSFLGTSNYRPCRYSFRDEWCSDAVSFVQTANVQRLSELTGEPIPATVFATPRARSVNEDALREEFAAFDLRAPHIVEVPRGDTEGEFERLLAAFLSTFAPDEKRVDAVFDITHGFRSQPVVGLLALGYLAAAFEAFEVDDLLYGAYDLRKHENADFADTVRFPVLSLVGHWDLLQWAGAWNVFRRTGEPGALVDLSNERRGRIMRGLKGTPPDELASFTPTLRAWHEAVAACCVPLIWSEDGGAARSVLDAATMEWNEFSQNLERYTEPLRHSAREVFAPMQADTWSTLEGLEAQLALMEWLGRHERHQAVLTIAREWLVTAVCLATGTDPTEKEGRSFAAALMGLSHHAVDQIPKRITAALGSSFPRVVGRTILLRNKLNHAWMSYQEPRNPGKVVASGTRNVLDGLAEVLGELRNTQADRGGLLQDGRTLFTALGKSPGVLLTACVVHRPDRVAILTSDECAPLVDEALDRLPVEVDRPSVHIRTVDDPFADFAAAASAALALMFESVGHDNILNVAGGTTALQHGVESLTRYIGQRVGAVVDRRPVQEQRQEPYVIGDWVWARNEGQKGSKNDD